MKGSVDIQLSCAKVAEFENPPQNSDSYNHSPNFEKNEERENMRGQDIDKISGVSNNFIDEQKRDLQLKIENLQ